MLIITPQQSFPSHQAFNPLMADLISENKHNCHLNKGGDKVVISNNNTSTNTKAHNKPCRSMNPNTFTKSYPHHHHQAIKTPTMDEVILRKMMHHCHLNNTMIDLSSTQEQQEAEAKAAAIILERRLVHYDETSKVAAKVSLDVAGFTVDDIAIQVDNHIIGITAERKNRLGDVFQIQRKVCLDKHTADEEDINASITDGILEIVVGKKKSAKIGPRVISISTSTNTTVSSNFAETSKDNNDVDENEEIDDVNTKSDKKEEESKLKDNTDANIKRNDDDTRSECRDRKPEQKVGGKRNCPE